MTLVIMTTEKGNNDPLKISSTHSGSPSLYSLVFNSRCYLLTRTYDGSKPILPLTYLVPISHHSVMLSSIRSFPSEASTLALHPAQSPSDVEEHGTAAATNVSSAPKYDHETAEKYINACRHTTTKIIILMHGSVSTMEPQSQPACNVSHREAHNYHLQNFCERVKKEFEKTAPSDVRGTLLTACKTIAGEWNGDRTDKGWRCSVAENTNLGPDNYVDVTIGDQMFNIGDTLFRLPTRGEVRSCWTRALRGDGGSGGISEKESHQEDEALGGKRV